MRGNKEDVSHLTPHFYHTHMHTHTKCAHRATVAKSVTRCIVIMTPHLIITALIPSHPLQCHTLLLKNQKPVLLSLHTKVL